MDDYASMGQILLDSTAYSLTIRPLSGTRRMRCAQGHEWTAEPWEISTVVGAPECHSGPLCPYCYVEWHRRQFPAEEVT